jgi:hypothetical protein
LRIRARKPGVVIPVGSITPVPLALISGRGVADAGMLASTRMGFSSAGCILLVIAHSRVKTVVTAVAVFVSLHILLNSCVYYLPLHRLLQSLPGVLLVGEDSWHRKRQHPHVVVVVVFMMEPLFMREMPLMAPPPLQQHMRLVLP